MKKIVIKWKIAKKPDKAIHKAARYFTFKNLSIHLTQLLVTSDLKRQIGAFTAASARRSKRVS